MIANAAEKFLRAYHNEGVFEFEHDGELFLMLTYAGWCKDQATVIWDVGANSGQWARMMHAYLPKSTVESFEIVPAIADIYRQTMEGHSWASLHQTGLSDAVGTVDVFWHADSDQESSIHVESTHYSGDSTTLVTCPVSTIDQQIADGLPVPHFLKIDTEGHEAAVLRGARNLLSAPHAPELIQLEYGTTWLPAGETRMATQRLLEDCGYAVGRLHPQHVEFKPYDLRDDHFLMGHLIAVRDPALKAQLSG